MQFVGNSARKWLHILTNLTLGKIGHDKSLLVHYSALKGFLIRKIIPINNV